MANMPSSETPEVQFGEPTRFMNRRSRPCVVWVFHPEVETANASGPWMSMTPCRRSAISAIACSGGAQLAADVANRADVVPGSRPCLVGRTGWIGDGHSGSPLVPEPGIVSLSSGNQMVKHGRLMGERAAATDRTTPRKSEQ